LFKLSLLLDGLPPGALYYRQNPPAKLLVLVINAACKADYSSFGLPPSFSGRSHGAAGDNRHCEPDHPSPGSSTFPSDDLFDSAWSGLHTVYLDVQLKPEHQELCMSVQAHGDNYAPVFQDATVRLQTT
jgi:hypothetical protein